MNLQVWALLAQTDGSYVAHRATETYRDTAQVVCCPVPIRFSRCDWHADGLAGVRSVVHARVVECAACADKPLTM